jgi:hypothetical protein
MSNNDTIADTWQRIKTIIDSMDVDMQKSKNGNASAGVRVRRGLRLMKKEASILVKTMVEEVKQNKAAEASTETAG